MFGGHDLDLWDLASCTRVPQWERLSSSRLWPQSGDHVLNSSRSSKYSVLHHSNFNFKLQNFLFNKFFVMISHDEHSDLRAWIQTDSVSETNRAGVIFLIFNIFGPFDGPNSVSEQLAATKQILDRIRKRIWIRNSEFCVVKVQKHTLP